VAALPEAAIAHHATLAAAAAAAAGAPASYDTDEMDDDDEEGMYPRDPYGNPFGAPYGDRYGDYDDDEDSEMDPYGMGYDADPLGMGYPGGMYGAGYGAGPVSKVNPWTYCNDEAAWYTLKNHSTSMPVLNPRSAGPLDTLAPPQLQPFPLTEKHASESIVQLGTLDIPVKVRLLLCIANKYSPCHCSCAHATVHVHLE
jgi:hypothetical protein